MTTRTVPRYGLDCDDCDRELCDDTDLPITAPTRTQILLLARRGL